MSRSKVIQIAAFVVLVFHLTTARTTASSSPEPYDTEPDHAGPMGPNLAASQMILPPGFKASVFAAEPDVQNPIAMTWDARGRLWIAENYTYSEAPKRFDFGLRDRILIFEDETGEGHFTKRKVFTDELQLLTSIEVGHGGVWAMCPPNLVYIPANETLDNPAGSSQVVLDGFHIPAESYHNFANGLRWGPDGWLYGRCGGTAPASVGAPGTPDSERIPMRGGMWRYHPKRRVFEALQSGTTNPWGHDWDKHGELFFVNTVNGHLWHGITGAHFVRGSTLDPNPHAYALIDQHADHWHFDTALGWGKSRDGAANSMGGGHAHIGALIYKGNNWPEPFRDRLYTFNMHGLRANQEILERQGSGYVGKHGEDFLFAKDNWFRGLDLSSGPDGAVYAIDWSDTGECHERNGVHRHSGRIFKIQYGETGRPEQVRLDHMSTAELVELLKHPNDWQARMAQRVITERSAGPGPAGEAEKLLLAAFEQNVSTVHKLRVMWTLHSAGMASRAFLESQLTHRDEHLRVWAIRLLTDQWRLDTPDSKRPANVMEHTAEIALAKRLCQLAQEEHSGLVRLTLASALQRLPVEWRAALASSLVAHPEDADDHNLPLMVWYGLIPVAKSRAMDLLEVEQASRWPQVRKYIARRFAEDAESHPAPLSALIERSASSGTEESIGSTIEGMSEGLKGWRKAPKPTSWDLLLTKAGQMSGSILRDRLLDLSVLFGDGRALDEIKRIALDQNADLSARKSALMTLIENKPADLRETCELLLSTRFLNAVAAKGLALFDDTKIGEKLVRAYSSFHLTDRPQLVSIIVSRPSFIPPLLSAIESNKFPRTILSAFDVRQIRNLKDPDLDRRLNAVWGELRESSADKSSTIALFKAQLGPDVVSAADRSRGRVVFQTFCGPCHMMYGEGGKIGPDLTGSGRDNLDYLLENIVDPGAVVPADFRMTSIKMRDGRTLTGMIQERSAKTLAIQLMTERSVIERDAIERLEESPQSLMPEGLLEAMTPVQRRDLIGYLIQKTQAPMPAETQQR